MSVIQSPTATTAADEGVVDLDEDIFFDASEITSRPEDQQEAGQVPSGLRIVDVAPNTFYLNQRANNMESQKQSCRSERQSRRKVRTIARKRKSALCFPRWLLSAPAWVQFLGFGGFVLVVSSMVFLAVYHFIPWSSTDNPQGEPSSLSSAPDFSTPEYPHDLHERPPPSPPPVAPRSVPR